MAQADDIVRRLGERYPVIDKGWQRIPASGYTDRKLMVVSDDGIVGEVQIWLPGATQIRKRSHELYKVARRNDATPEQKEAAMREMRALHEAHQSGCRRTASPFSPDCGLKPRLQ